MEYPITDWDLKEYCLQDIKNEGVMYDLTGVVHHFGKMGGGHYISVAYNFVKERWLKFDDERVSYAESKDVQSRAAYVLFYKRRR